MFFFAALCTTVVQAAPGIDDEWVDEYTEQEIAPVTTMYMDNVFSNGGWGANWFATVQGGVAAFVGKPVGHGDFFDRTKPVFTAAIGKWITPTVGIRVAYQGLKFVDGTMQSRSYQNLHGDVMYNISNALRTDYETLSKWDVIPFVGLGLIHNKFTGEHPFAISFGVSARYRISERLHITGEIGNSITSQRFDGIGNNHFGDNMLQASVGLTATIGKVGWKRVVDPKPYMLQNDILSENLNRANKYIHSLKIQKMHDAQTLAEMHKILEIEGLLDKYNLSPVSEKEEVKNFPKNNYSGLNSLRARLRGKTWNPEKNGTNTDIGEHNYQPNSWNPNDTTELDPEQYFKLMRDGKIFVGTPVFFFFKIGTANLGEKAQAINIREIASVIKKYGLYARIVGAADSQTGTAYTNEKLSQARADYIAKKLKEQGVSEERISKQYKGGISTYVPLEGNRNTCVMLYFKEK